MGIAARRDAVRKLSAETIEEYKVSRKSDNVKETTEATAPTIAEGATQPERGMSHVDEALVGMMERAEQAVLETALSEEAPTIDRFATYWSEFDLRCRDCQIIHYVPLCLFLNAKESPALVQRIISNHFNMKRCPVCHQVEYVEHPFSYYDPARKLIVQVRPEWEWHAGGGEEWYAARLEDLFDKWAEHDVQIEVVFGPQQLIDRFLQDVPPPPARR
jgi:hypothetical protein